MIRRFVFVGAALAAALTAGILFPALSAAPVRPRAIPPQRRPISFQDRLLPAPVGGGFRDPGYWVWCGTVVRGDDGRYHHYASRWPRALPFSPHWLTNSVVGGLDRAAQRDGRLEQLPGEFDDPAVLGFGRLARFLGSVRVSLGHGSASGWRLI
jgi:hypothetical protein